MSEDTQKVSDKERYSFLLSRHLRCEIFFEIKMQSHLFNTTLLDNVKNHSSQISEVYKEFEKQSSLNSETTLARVRYLFFLNLAFFKTCGMRKDISFGSDY